MQQFSEKYHDQIMGVVTGFDRLVFGGSLRRLNYGWGDDQLKAMVAIGMEQYLWHNKILFKDYQQHVKRASERWKKESLKPFEKQGLPVVFLRSASVDQEELARRVAGDRGIQTGLVCALSTLEPSPTLEHRGTHPPRLRWPRDRAQECKRPTWLGAYPCRSECSRPIRRGQGSLVHQGLGRQVT